MDAIKKFFSDVIEIFKNIRARYINPNASQRLKRSNYYLGYALRFALKAVATVLVVIIGSLAIITVYGSMYVSKTLEIGDLPDLINLDLDQSTLFYAKDGESGEYVEIDSISAGENRQIATYDEIPEYMKKAVVAIEDKRFWTHEGVDWRRSIGALSNMFLQMRDNFGGSTITQQLLKNLTGNDDVTVQRKIEEIFSALAFEKIYEKEAILESYLNTIYLGEGCYGVKTAAEEYFGKELGELTIAECASLVGITNNPYIFDPYINPKRNQDRQRIILSEMHKQELITDVEYNVAVAQKLVFKRKTKERATKVHSWNVEECIKQIIDDLQVELNSNATFAEQYLFTQGLKVYTTFDMKLQDKMDEVWFNADKWPKSGDPERPQSSFVLMDPYSGSVLAMEGSRDKKTLNKPFNYATDARRQPGSSLKPLSTYSVAFEEKLITPASSFLDAPVSVIVDKGKSRGWPKNAPVGYDGRMPILNAVAKSKNTVAIRVMQAITPQLSAEYLTSKFHLSTILTETVNGQNDVDLAPLALGALTNGARVLEMAAGYCAFPNEGIYIKPRMYTSVTDLDNETILENTPKRNIAISELSAFYMIQCLKQATSAGGTGSKAKWGNMPVAGKTGTTSSDYDRWFCGFTPYYVGVCWVGYSEPRSLVGYASNPGLVLWKAIMEPIHEDLPVIDFKQPAGLVTAEYCLDSGLKPTAACHSALRGTDTVSRTAKGTFAPEDVPKNECNMHVFVSYDTSTGYIARPDCPTEVLRQVALLRDTDRVMPIGNVVIADEQYTWRQSGYAAYSGLDAGAGRYAPVAPNNKDGSHLANEICPVIHTTTPVDPSIPPSPTDPTVTIEPTPSTEPSGPIVPVAP